MASGIAQEAIVEEAEASPTPQEDADQNGRENVLGWGQHSNEDVVAVVNSIYEELAHWRKNLFKVPSGAAGKRFIQMKTTLINHWCEGETPIARVALKIVMIMPGILLQKPCKKTSAKQNSEYLNKRMDEWERGDFDNIMKEARGIQEKMKLNKSIFDDPDHISKIFTRNMLLGKVHAALRVLEKSEAMGVAEMTDQTIENLITLELSGLSTGRSHHWSFPRVVEMVSRRAFS